MTDIEPLVGNVPKSLDLSEIDDSYEFDLVKFGGTVMICCMLSGSEVESTVYIDPQDDEYTTHWTRHSLTCNMCGSENRAGRELFGEASASSSKTNNEANNVKLCTSCFDEFMDTVQKVIEENKAILVSLEV